MLRLRSSILTQVPSSSSVAFPSKSSLRRLLSATAAPSISPNPGFAVEDYLVDTCGLTRAQALRAAPKISHLKSSKPDAVLRFLAGLGVSNFLTGQVADVSSLIKNTCSLQRNTYGCMYQWLSFLSGTTAIASHVQVSGAMPQELLPSSPYNVSSAYSMILLIPSMAGRCGFRARRCLMSHYILDPSLVSSSGTPYLLNKSRDESSMQSDFHR